METKALSYSSRITGAELPRNGKSILVRSYTVQARENNNYQAALQGDKPFVEIDWPINIKRQYEIMTPEMLNLLVPQDAVEPLNAKETCVLTDPYQSYSEGLRILSWIFKEGEGPILVSRWSPGHLDDGVTLLGSATEGGDRLKIDGINYFIQPEVALRGKCLWERMLYAQDHGMIYPLSPAVTTAAKFTMPERPDREWVRSEVERFERNGASLKEEQVGKLYKQLRSTIWEYAIIAGEILALPITRSEKTGDSVKPKAPRTGFDILEEITRRAQMK